MSGNKQITWKWFGHVRQLGHVVGNIFSIYCQLLYKIHPEGYAEHGLFIMQHHLPQLLIYPSVWDVLMNNIGTLLCGLRLCINQVIHTSTQIHLAADHIPA